jgi:hypothetical protein
MTKRNQNTKTENEGIRYVMGVVQDHNSIFQPIARENDQGNDCYIEFVENGRATNFAIFVQIKSGASYKDIKGYKIPADRGHMLYWSGGNSLSIGIVYDPDTAKAYWIDIVAYLKERPEVQKQKHHAIRLETAQEFSMETFPAFAAYCRELHAGLASDAGFSKSLEDFSRTDIPSVCYEGFKSLVSVHKERPASWHYITLSFARIKEEGIRGNILGMISRYIYSADTFYRADSAISQTAAEMVLQSVKKNFGRAEVKAVYPFIAEGIMRGSFSYRVYMILCEIEGLSAVLRQISFDSSTDTDKRLFWFWLYVNVHKVISSEETLADYSLFTQQCPEALDDETLTGTVEGIRDGDLFPLG